MACSCSFSQGGFQIASKNSFIAWLLVLQSFRLRVKAQMCSVTKAWAETTFTFSTEKVKKSRRWGGGWDKDEGQNQCDQIWRNFPILAIFKSLRLLREGLFSVGQKFETALVNILWHWANFFVGSGLKLTNNLAIWSHWAECKKIDPKKNFLKLFRFSLEQVNLISEAWLELN